MGEGWNNTAWVFDGVVSCLVTPACGHRPALAPPPQRGMGVLVAGRTGTVTAMVPCLSLVKPLFIPFARRPLLPDCDILFSPTYARCQVGFRLAAAAWVTDPQTVSLPTGVSGVLLFLPRALAYLASN